MPITAIPKGVELRKITAVQKRALDELITKERGSSALTTALVVGIPSIVAGSAILAYVFKEEAQEWFKDQTEEIWPTIKKAIVESPVNAGGVVADIITTTLARFALDPITPEVVQGSTLTRCTRFAVDATDIKAKIITGDVGTIEGALSILTIAKQMKTEGCNRPSSITPDQWKEA